MANLQVVDLIKQGVDIIFPRRCAACGKKLFGALEGKICNDCISDISFLRLPVCRVCGMELVGHQERKYLCGGCLAHLPPYLLARSVVRYSASVRQLVHGLKYRADTSVLPGIAEIFLQYDLAPFEQCDYVIPVPLHIKRLRQRGLNQSVLLAKLIFRQKIQPILKTNCLIRTRNTVPQTALDGAKRRGNLKGAFIVAGKVEIDGKRICLVDDVFTTGTTVYECSRVLLNHGAKEVRVITLARVVL